MKKSLRKLQIGVMGSMADLKYSAKTERLAKEVGYWVAKSGATLVFGAEKDSDSLSTAACRGAKRGGGLTVGVTYGKGLNVYEKNVDVVIASGLERGGGRELTLVLSCDAIIVLNGGSGTLTEIAIAYQANIPIVVVKGTGGWSEKLADQYLDSRKRIKVELASGPKAAVKKAISLSKQVKLSTPDLLFLTAVHGNEKIGAEVLSQMTKNDQIYNWLIANEKAAKVNKRFVDKDLNRTAPGQAKSSQYEIRRAYELMQIAKKYRYVIDIHGTKAKIGIFTIVTNPTLSNLMLASALPIQNIVIWYSQDSKQSGPITQFVDLGVEIECGPKNSPNIKQKLAQILKKIVEDGITMDAKNIKSKTLFKVYGKLRKQEVPKSIAAKMQNFKQTNFKGEKFIPLLIGEYPDLVCYKMQKVKLDRLLSY